MADTDLSLKEATALYTRLFKEYIAENTNDTSHCVQLTGGTMTGALIAQSNSDYTVAQVRNVTMSTSAASGGSNGQVHYTYE